MLKVTYILVRSFVYKIINSIVVSSTILCIYNNSLRSKIDVFLGGTYKYNISKRFFQANKQSITEKVKAFVSQNIPKTKKAHNITIVPSHPQLSCCSFIPCSRLPAS